MSSIACYAHPTLPTVAACTDCSRGLCTNCERLLRPPLCAECMERRTAVIAGGVYRRLYAFCVLAAIGVIGGIWVTHVRVPPFVHLGPLVLRSPRLPRTFGWAFPLGLGYVLGGVVYGRRALAGRRRVRPFVMTIDLLILFGVIETIAGFVVGVIVTPFAMIADARAVKTQQTLLGIVRRATGAPVPARVLSARID